MPHILELPVLYRVRGIPKGKRKPVVVPVSECVPFEVHDIDDPGERVEFATSSFTIANRRPWFPIVGRRDQPMTVEAANAAARAFVDAAPDPWQEKLDKTGVLPLVGRRIRRIADPDGTKIVVRSGEDWRRSFSRVDATDRVESVSMADHLTERLRVMGKNVVTDRYDPIQVSNRTPNIDGTFVYDAVTGLLNTVVRQNDGDLSYSPHRIGPDRDVGMLPFGEPWFDRIDWRAEPSELIALWLERRLRYPLAGDEKSALHFREAIGHRAVVAMTQFVAWGDSRRIGTFPAMTDADLTRAIADLREAMASAERIEDPERIDRVERDLIHAEESLSQAMRHAARPTAEDADVLRMPFA